MYNLLEHSDDYFITSEILWSYYRGKMNDTADEIVVNLRLNNKTISKSKSFEYKKIDRKNTS